MQMEILKKKKMKKIVKFIKLKEIDISSIRTECQYYDNTDFSRYIKTLGYDPVSKYHEDRKNLKDEIIKALSECDDFSIDYFSDDYSGDSCSLTTYKVEVESDKDLKKRKIKAQKAAKISILKSKKEKEENDKREYERLKKKFEKS